MGRKGVDERGKDISMRCSSIVGLDVGKDELVGTLVQTADKSIIWRDNFTNDTKGISRLLEKAPFDSPIVLEPTGRYGNALVEMATLAGRMVYLAPGRRAKAYQRSIQARAKTDPKDSYGLALFGDSQRLWQYRLKSASVDELDQNLSYRKQLSKTITRMDLQARSMPYVSSAIHDTIKELKNRLAEQDKKIATLVKTNPQFQMITKLQAVPGFGPVTSTSVGSRLIHKQFTHPDQFIAYIGMDIGVIQSGKRKGTWGMTKEGDAELRRLLYLAAQASLRVKDSPFQTQFVRELAKGHSKTQAICAIARKLAKLAWSIVHHESSYDPDRVYKNQREKQIPN
jgi:transposase